MPRRTCFTEKPSVRQGCNLAHVLGLFRITGTHTTAVALGARGALADMALWAIARLQTRLCASRTFAKCACAQLPGRMLGPSMAIILASCARQPLRRQIVALLSSLE